MRLEIAFLGALAFMGLATTEGWAASLPNPQLTALDSGVNDEEAVSRALEIADLQVQVEIVGNVAETTLTARFVNPTRDDLEGTFTLQMPDGAVVTGYALDVDDGDGDVMIDGVLMPPVRARLVFDEKLRAGVDPGVAEVRRGNVFSTRVYPIFEKGRTIRLRFAAPMTATHGYALPLVSGANIGQVKLTVRARNVDVAPALTWPAAAKSEWRRENGALVNDITLKGQALDGQLWIAPPASVGRAFVTRHANGRRFAELRDEAEGQAPAVPPPRSLRIYWDRSSSRRDDALAREHELLERYLVATAISNIEVVSFNSSGTRASPAHDAAVITRTLRGLDYRGATSFAVLSGKTGATADVCLLFSDGVATIDTRPELRFGCQLHAITSAPDADLGYLGLLARGSGGAAVSLARLSVDDALRMLQAPAPRVLEARSEEGESLRFASLEAGARGWALVVDAPLHGDLILRISGIEAGIVERRYALLNDHGQFSGAGALWAGNRVMELAGDAQRETEMRELSQRYSVASPAMSFIVLEAPEDYVQAGVAPPANYPGELMEEYLEAKQDAAEEATERKEDWLGELVDEWEAQKEWWEEKYKSAKSVEEMKNVLATSPAPPPVATPAPATAPAPAPNAREMGQLPDRNTSGALQRVAPSIEMISTVDEVMVTGMRGSDAGPKISLQLEPWKPDRSYLKALDAAVGPGEYARELDAQESRFGAMPAFYFDVAEWLYRHERVPEAIDMLLSALELPARDSQTLALVADRLQRYGAMDRAIWAYEQVLRMEPHRPQPARNLALALAQRALGARGAAARADLERALALLTELIMTPVDDDYEGIELVALMDANEIIPRLRAAGSRRVDLDPRLIALLDVDLRVVIEWNTPGTDMDLWVDQPDEERAIYNNPRTAVGGQLSNDMTSGYGPEQYLLRRSINGEYAIKVNVYAADAINPNGATMVTAHLTRNYGRRSQRTETMELELNPGDEGEMLIGRFRVGRQRL